MKVLVLGGGGREHALVWKLRQSPRISAALLRARQRRHRGRSRVPARRSEESGLDGGAGDAPAAGFDGGRPRVAADAGRCGRVHAAWMARVRADAGSGAAGIEQELRQGISAAASHSHGSLCDLRFDRAGALGARAFPRAGGGEGGRAGGGQGRGHREKQGRGGERRGGDAERPDAGRGRGARRAGRMPDGRRTVVPGIQRRGARGAAGGRRRITSASATATPGRTPAAWVRIRRRTSWTIGCATGW